MTTDPNAQRSFIENNPFFDSLLQGERDRTLANQAAAGKLGSGGTLKALDENVLRLGEGLLGNQVNRLSNLANIGQQASTNQANIAQNFGTNASNLLTGQGAVNAAGTIGAANANQAGSSNLLQLGGSLVGGNIGGNLLNPLAKAAGSSLATKFFPGS